MTDAQAGGFFEALSEFLNWAKGYDDPAFDGRSRAAHDAWLAQLDLPVLHLSSELSVVELRDAVLKWEPS